MSITLNYYNYFFTYNGKKTNYKISEFFKEFMKIPSEKRLKNIPKLGEFTLFDGIKPTMDEAIIADGLASRFSNFDRLVYFGQYREDKPYTGQKGKDIANEIKQDVLEVTHCAFFPNSQLLVLPYKHFGAKAAHLELYIQKFLPKDEGNNWGFELHQIEDGRGLSTILRSKDIRSLDISFDMTGNTSFEEYLPKDKLFQEFTKSFIRVQKEMGSNVGRLNFSTGRKTSNPMDIKKILYFLQNSEFTSSMFQSAKVKYKDPDNYEMITTDLKHEGLMKIELELNSDETGLEFISKKILEKYIETGKMGSSKHLTYTDLERKYESDCILSFINEIYLK